MNESGRSIAAAARFFKVDPSGLLVVHDDVDLEPGGSRPGSAVGSPATTACARSRRRWGRTTSCASESASAVPAGATVGASPTTSSRSSTPRRTSTRLVARAADAVEAIASEGLDEAQRRFN